MQTLTLLPECLNEKKDESHLVVGKYPYIYFFNCYKTHTHISFSVILAGILRAGKKHFLGNLAVRFVCRMHSTFANCRTAHALSESSNFSRENISCLPRRVLYHVSIFYVSQTDSVLNFARGQTPADDTCVY